MRQEPPHHSCGGSCPIVPKEVSDEYFTVTNNSSVKYGTHFKRDTC